MDCLYFLLIRDAKSASFSDFLLCLIDYIFVNLYVENGL